MLHIGKPVVEMHLQEAILCNSSSSNSNYYYYCREIDSVRGNEQEEKRSSLSQHSSLRRFCVCERWRVGQPYCCLARHNLHTRSILCDNPHSENSFVIASAMFQLLSSLYSVAVLLIYSLYLFLLCQFSNPVHHLCRAI